MQKIMIIGSNGAGKSTFSYRLAEKTGLPLTHIDQIYWHGKWEVTPREEFERKVWEIAQSDRWIIEGNNTRSLHQRLRYADAVIWFEFPPAQCVWNVIKREIRHWGKARPDMPETCISRLEWSFLRHVWKFNGKYRKRIENCLLDAPQVKVFHVKNYREAEAVLECFSAQKK